jgi:hypothetical protein
MDRETRMRISAILPTGSVAPPTAIPITRLGRPAAAMLRAESRWEVRAVFRRSFYCRNEAGAFVCFGPLTLGSGPLNVLCRMPEPMNWEAAGLMAGSSVASDGTIIRVAERFAFSLAGAKIWRPEGPPAPWQPAAMMASLTELAGEVSRWPARGGLQALVPVLIKEATVSAAGVPAASPLIRMAMDGIELLREWLQRRFAGAIAATPVPASAIDALLGLGPGLTPSGDDFLAGVLVALRYLGAPDVAGAVAVELLPRSRQRTNEISHAHLAAAAGGEALAPLHDILAGLGIAGAFRGGASLSAIDAIGHTSGWDALAGVTFAAAVMARAWGSEKGLVPPDESTGSRVVSVLS